MPSIALDDGQSANPVDEINQTALIHENIVTANALRTRRDIGHVEGTHLCVAVFLTDIGSARHEEGLS